MRQNKTKKQVRRKKPGAPWPLLLIGGGLLLVFGAVFAFARPSAARAPIAVTGAPSLKADQEDVNLGDVKLGQTVEVSFKVTNVGSEALRFTKEPYIEVKEGC